MIMIIIRVGTITRGKPWKTRKGRMKEVDVALVAALTKAVVMVEEKEMKDEKEEEEEGKTKQENKTKAVMKTTMKKK